MGRPPANGAPAFRFNPTEVAQMDAVLREHKGHVPPKEILVALANQFSNSPERSGKVIVQMKQVWNWFQNRRYALREKLVKSPGKLNMSPNSRSEVASVRNVPPVSQQIAVPSGHNVVRNTPETPPMEFEAKSARDGAWYDVQVFLSHRYLETGNPEVLVRFAGFGPEEDEWVNVRKHVRHRSLPCESSECVVVLPGDLILCFQEGKEQALYFDAHVLDAQRRRHDVRRCRCRFLVRYDHDQSEEIVPLRKVCRRPETDFRLQQLHAANESASADPQKPVTDPTMTSTLTVANPTASAAATAVRVTRRTMNATPAGPPPSAPTPATIPEPNKSGSDNPGTLAGEAAAQANVNDPGAATTRVFTETKKAGSCNPETSMLTESIIPPGDTSNSPTTAVARPEKVESSVAAVGDAALASSTAAVGSGATVSTAAESSTLSVSAEGTKE